MAYEPVYWEVTWKFESKSFKTLRSLAEEITYKARQTVFGQGDSPDGLYLVLDGFALVIATDADSGADRTVGIVEKGQSFGELGLLIDQPRMATVAAGTELKVLRITPDALKSLEKEAPDVAVLLYKTLARTLAEQLITMGNLLREPKEVIEE